MVIVSWKICHEKKKELSEIKSEGRNFVNNNKNIQDCKKNKRNHSA